STLDYLSRGITKHTTTQQHNTTTMSYKQKSNNKPWFSALKKERDLSHHKDHHTVSFDVIKVNSYGKRQQRTIAVSSQGVSNLNGQTCQWFVQNSDVYSIHQESDTQKFTLTFLHKYHFEADSAEQAKQIVADFKRLGVGNKKKSKKKKLTIEDFDLMKVLGVGSFGRVFLVKKKDTGQLYAMKVLNKRDILKKKQLAHTNTEKMVLSTMDHPFIVRLHFAFQNDEYLFMCMDYIPGGELFQHLQKAGRFPEELAKFYIAEVITSLNYLHSNNIIYRDIKPENILLGADGHIKLTDFGLSKSGITSVVGGKNADGQFATTFCGTPEYLAPEIITGAGHGKAADWWSVGILLFEMLTGRSPFLASNRNDMYKAMIQGNLRLPMFLSSEAQDLLEKLLVPDPKNRLGTGGVADIQNHAFFDLIPWRLLESKMITPPFKPTISVRQLHITIKESINIHTYTRQSIKEIVASKDDPDLNPAITFKKQKRKSSTSGIDAHFKGFSWNKDDSFLDERESVSSTSSSPGSSNDPSPLLLAVDRQLTLKNMRKSS
ncbi:hypothetical protein SAMD00019534_059650, partial [Acytostelium subglobosum LB1]|uniref:hypothetical protein n=1 Tax=Acytostelium subglobosum LB1 TaxID=1410327 RepID=UPI000644F13F